MLLQSPYQYILVLRYLVVYFLRVIVELGAITWNLDWVIRSNYGSETQENSEYIVRSKQKQHTNDF